MAKKTLILGICLGGGIASILYGALWQIRDDEGPEQLSPATHAEYPPPGSAGGVEVGGRSEATIDTEQPEGTAGPGPLDVQALLADPRAALGALNGHQILRGDIDEDLFNELQNRAARNMLARFGDSERSGLVEKFATPMALSAVIPRYSESDLSEADRECFEAIDRAYQPLLMEAATRAFEEFEASLDADWNHGNYVSWAVGEPVPPRKEADPSAAMRRSSSVTVADRCFRSSYSSQRYPAVEMAFQSLRDLRQAMADEKRSYWDGR